MLDTKWKNSKAIRTAITVIALLLLALVMLGVSLLNVQKVGQNNQNYAAESVAVDDTAVLNLYRGCYILYWEIMQESAGTQEKLADFYYPEESRQISEWDYRSDLEPMYEDFQAKFEEIRNKLDYDAEMGTVNTTNTSEELGIFHDNVLVDSEKTSKLKEKYPYLFRLYFDENGVLDIQIINSGDASEDDFLKAVQKAARKSLLEQAGYQYEIEIQPRKITDFSVVFGVTAESEFGIVSRLEGYSVYNQLQGTSLAGYELAVIFLFILMLLMTSNRIWKGTIVYTRQGVQYFMELALVGTVFIVVFFGMQISIQYDMYYEGIVPLQNMTSVQVAYLLTFYLCLLAGYTCIYLVMLYIRPVFSLGLKRYIQEYSLCWLLCRKVRESWAKIKRSLLQVDLSTKSNKTIIRLLAVNFVILAILMCMWFGGIFGLLIYSVILFFVLQKYYTNIVEDFQKLLADTRSIARGEFQAEQVHDYGVFQTMGNELGRIQEDFENAINREIKSERLKSELITNVSHDLKTPLTAITTYVELLKKPDITEEERASYIETLEKKSQRLKVLIEDLFEVSKASSNNVVLHYVDVDVVNLMKQVYVEHADKYEEMGLIVKWRVPEERVILSLDSQKTYRIFENLFTNVQKYAMPGSRVYVQADCVQVQNLPKKLVISIKNISATELDVKPEELTERFVRGDASRNTEGSGLGLAIAKSFVEAQKGSFEILVDGDLFKVVIQFEVNEDSTTHILS